MPAEPVGDHDRVAAASQRCRGIRADPEVVPLTRLLRDHGHRNGIIGKVEHLQPYEQFCWDASWDRADLGCGRSPRRYGQATAEFIASARAADQPWFLMANTHDPHRPWHGSEDERRMFNDDQLAEIEAPSRTFEPGEPPPPGFLPDLPEVRTEYAQYLSSARRCDDAVGAILKAVRDAGAEADTVVIFLSDNGVSFPFAKANCYFRSSRTPLLVQWPGLADGGIDLDDGFVSAIDIFPTLCEAAGIPVPEGIDGFSLTGLIDGRPTDQDRHRRDYVVTSFHETRSGRRLEMRALQDARFGYIWNQWSDGVTEYRAENMAGLTWPAMVAAADDDQDLAARTAHYRWRTPEELYDLQDDPDALHNLAGDPDHAQLMLRLRTELQQWLSRVEDPLADQFADFLGSVTTPAR